MLNIKEGQRVTIWSVENHDTYSMVKMSSSRKDQKSNEYKNSNWNFVRFVAEAHKKASQLKERDRIELKGAGISSEAYIDKEGKKVYPKNPQIVVFNWDYLDAAPAEEKHPVVEDDDKMPF